MKVLGIYGSPRKNGNSDLLLQEALKGAQSLGAETQTIRSFDLKISGCHECGACDKTGVCVIKDDMDEIYPKLVESEVIILASPMFFLRCHFQRQGCHRSLPGLVEQKND